MINFKTYMQQQLQESSTEETLKRHLSHLEDLAVEEGKRGFAKFVEQVENFTSYLEGFNSKTSVNLKVDGAPALFWGIDPRPEHNDQFFIATKSVFSKTPNLIHSEQEVDTLYQDAAPGLKAVLKTVFPYLKQGYDNSGLTYQGDLLFSPSRPPQVKQIEGQNYLTFQPNLISYAILADPNSELYKSASKAPVGIVVHAAFNINATPDGKGVTTSMAGRDTSRIVTSLKRAGVFAEGSNYKTLNLHLDPNLKNTLHGLLEDSKRQIHSISNQFDAEYVSNSTLVAQLREYLNYMVRSGGGMFKAALSGETFNIDKFLKGFSQFAAGKINKKAAAGSPKVQANAKKKIESLNSYLSENRTALSGLLGATYDMIRIKLIFQNLLANAEGKLKGMYSFIPVGDAYVSAPGEGHVLYIGDTPNQVKIVDRLNFSANNFLYAGERGRKPAEQVTEDEQPTERTYSIGFFGGGFNPPHIGHFEAAKMAAKENDDVYIIVSRTDRDNSGITLEKKLAVWRLYVPLLEQYRAKVHIVEAEVSPVRTTYEYVATLNGSPDANKITVNLYSDVEDAGRYDNIAKYAENLAKVNIRPTPRLGSGTEFRTYLHSGDMRRAWELMPQGVDKNMVWNILTAQ